MNIYLSFCGTLITASFMYLKYIYICKPHLMITIYLSVEKVKRKKNMFDGLFICQRVSTSIFF